MEFVPNTEFFCGLGTKADVCAQKQAHLWTELCAEMCLQLWFREVGSAFDASHILLLPVLLLLVVAFQVDLLPK